MTWILRFRMITVSKIFVEIFLNTVYFIFLLKQHVIFHSPFFFNNETILRNLFTRLYIFFLFEGTETLENRVLNFLRHFLWDFFLDYSSKINSFYITPSLYYIFTSQNNKSGHNKGPRCCTVLTLTTHTQHDTQHTELDCKLSLQITRCNRKRGGQTAKEWVVQSPAEPCNRAVCSVHTFQ
jgi:hypothetical protein